MQYNSTFGYNQYINYKKIYQTLSAGILSLFVIVFILQTLIIAFVGDEALNTGWFNIFLADVPFYCVGIWGFLFFMTKLPHKKPTGDGFRFSSFLSVLAIAFFAMLAGAIVGTYANEVLQIIFRGNISDDLTETTSTMNLWEEIIFLVIVAPFGEELVFRKLIIDRSWMYGELASIVFSAVCFGVYHGNVMQLFYTTAVGILLGYLYIRSGSYLLCVFVHSIINLFFGIIYPYVYTCLENGNYIVSKSVTEIIALSQWGFALVGFVVLLERCINKKMYINDYSPIGKKGRISGAFNNAPFIVFASVTGFFILLNYQVSSVSNSEETMQSMVRLFFK
jgi:membrane protease YdiL (CAAX protease family)